MPHGEWLGWDGAVQVRRLHLIANNTRFQTLPAEAGVSNLGSHVLRGRPATAQRRLAVRLGHPRLLAETSVEMHRYRNTAYRAAKWIAMGLTKGYVRSSGKYTDKHGVKKKIPVYPVQGDARVVLREPRDREELVCAAVDVRQGQAERRSQRSLLDEVLRVGEPSLRPVSGSSSDGSAADVEASDSSVAESLPPEGFLLSGADSLLRPNTDRCSSDSCACKFALSACSALSSLSAWCSWLSRDPRSRCVAYNVSRLASTSRCMPSQLAPRDRSTPHWPRHS